MNSKFTDITVSKRNILTDTYQVNFWFAGIKFYEVFRNEETANKAAKALKTGQWNPLENNYQP